MRLSSERVQEEQLLQVPGSQWQEHEQELIGGIDLKGLVGFPREYGTRGMSWVLRDLHAGRDVRGLGSCTCTCSGGGGGGSPCSHREVWLVHRWSRTDNGHLQQVQASRYRVSGGLYMAMAMGSGLWALALGSDVHGVTLAVVPRCTVGVLMMAPGSRGPDSSVLELKIQDRTQHLGSLAAAARVPIC